MSTSASISSTDSGCDDDDDDSPPLYPILKRTKSKPHHSNKNSLEDQIQTRLLQDVEKQGGLFLFSLTRAAKETDLFAKVVYGSLIRKPNKRKSEPDPVRKRVYNRLWVLREIFKKDPAEYYKCLIAHGVEPSFCEQLPNGYKLPPFLASRIPSEQNSSPAHTKQAEKNQPTYSTPPMRSASTAKAVAEPPTTYAPVVVSPPLKKNRPSLSPPCPYFSSPTKMSRRNKKNKVNKKSLYDEDDEEIKMSLDQPLTLPDIEFDENHPERHGRAIIFKTMERVPNDKKLVKAYKVEVHGVEYGDIYNYEAVMTESNSIQLEMPTQPYSFRCNSDEFYEADQKDKSADTSVQLREQVRLDFEKSNQRNKTYQTIVFPDKLNSDVFTDEDGVFNKTVVPYAGGYDLKMKDNKKKKKKKIDKETLPTTNLCAIYWIIGRRSKKNENYEESDEDDDDEDEDKSLMNRLQALVKPDPPSAEDLIPLPRAEPFIVFNPPDPPASSDRVDESATKTDNPFSKQGASAAKKVKLAESDGNTTIKNCTATKSSNTTGSTTTSKAIPQATPPPTATKPSNAINSATTKTCIPEATTKTTTAAKPSNTTGSTINNNPIPEATTTKTTTAAKPSNATGSTTNNIPIPEATATKTTTDAKPSNTTDNTAIKNTSKAKDTTPCIKDTKEDIAGKLKKGSRTTTADQSTSLREAKRNEKKTAHRRKHQPVVSDSPIKLNNNLEVDDPKRPKNKINPKDTSQEHIDQSKRNREDVTQKRREEKRKSVLNNRRHSFEPKQAPTSNKFTRNEDDIIFTDDLWTNTELPEHEEIDFPDGTESPFNRDLDDFAKDAEDLSSM